MSVMREARVLCLSLFIVNSHTHIHTLRSKRDLLGVDIYRDLNTSPSSANSPPNSWLYKFPPWFLPGNPAPEGFHSHRDTHKAGTPEFSMVDDGDILIIDNFGVSDLVGHINNVRVPGNSAFRDEVVQTLLDVKYSRGQNPAFRKGKVASEGTSGELVTPWLVPQSVPEPPLPSPVPTAPISLHDNHDNDVRDQTHGGKVNLVNTALRPNEAFPFISDNEDVFRTITSSREPTPTDVDNKGFRPSPFDRLRTARPINRAQVEHSSSNKDTFRPSKLISVTRVSEDSSPGAPAVTSPGQKHGVGNSNFQHNIISKNFFRDRQAVLLKASDRPRSSRTLIRGNDNDIGNPQLISKQDDPLWVPFVPGVPLFLQRSRRLSQTGSRGEPLRNKDHPHNSQLDTLGSPQDVVSDPQLRNREESESNSFQLPSSIQDIINSDSDTAQPLYIREPISVTSSRGTSSNRGDDGSDRWSWPTF
ncbi:uncharacterized protein [Procambarus clarkii]|uniref:uncharacterized protein n=1 Tax=Procambarus clarkii TaxID=6728 RepID=UPI0037448D86